MIPLVIVRPQPGADATAARARTLGLQPVIAPLFAIEPVAWVPPDVAKFDTLLLTSANAVRRAGVALGHYCALPVFAVGRATAVEAQKAGLSVVHSGTGGVDEVLADIAARGLTRVLHLAGRDHHPYPPSGLDITTCIVYAAAESEVVLPGPPYVALIHSERAAARFSQLAKRRTAIAIVAISADVASAVGSGWWYIAIAAAPDDAAMLALAARLCEEGAMPTTGAA